MSDIKQTILPNGNVLLEFTIPKEGADRLRHLQELAGLPTIEDALRLALGCTVQRLIDAGYTFPEAPNATD